jgi:dTDP-4-amino-4,6-dideoxygalactose transaminase
LKRVVDDLAIFGGQPAFEAPLHVGAPNVTNAEAFFARARRAFEARRFTNNGPLVREFEARLTEVTSVRHCIAVCNATMGLEMLVRALDLKGEVIVPSFTFVATAHALCWMGLRPVFCDIDPQSHTLDIESVERLISPRTSAILGVHVWGETCQVDDLEQLARKRGLRLIFDAAHALACSYRGRSVGSLGEAEVFSFHATKFVHAFEGGAITTADDRLAERLRLMRNFGFSDEDTVVSLGTNGKMTEVAAAMGLTSLDSLESIVITNRANYSDYRGQLSKLPGVSVYRYATTERRNYQYAVIEIDPASAGISRDALARILRAENIRARRYFYPGCHQMEPYASDQNAVRLPHTEAVAGRVLSLPTGTAIGPVEVEGICSVVRFAISRAPEIRSRLPHLGA